MTASATGRSLELYFIDGKPEGMQTAEVFNWTGHVLMTPRTRIAEALKRKEAQYTGIYLLLGEKDSEALAYIGESENIADRIKNHDQGKDWWTKAVVVTTGANNLHKAHVKYLESRLVERAREIGRTKLENGNTPPRSSLSEAAETNMEAFLDYLWMVLPALRIDMFLEYAKPSRPQQDEKPGATAPNFELVNKNRGLYATATLVEGEFIVEEGSDAQTSWDHKSTNESGYAQLHDELKKTGVLVENGPKSLFAKSYAFRSPSAAAAVVNGRKSNGPTEWKVRGSSQTYKEWEAAQLKSAV